MLLLSSSYLVLGPGFPCQEEKSVLLSLKVMAGHGLALLSALSVSEAQGSPSPEP